MPTEYVIDLGPVAVGLRTAEQGLVDYLSEFYEVITAAATGHGVIGWEIRAQLGEPSADMPRTRWGVGYTADPATGRALVVAPDEPNLAITVRKMAREALVEFCEARGATMLHASAVTDGARLVIVAGDKGAGKTTLALSAVLDRGWTLLSNDHLLLYRDGPELVATSLPTPIPVKLGTWCDWSHRLGTPWDVEGIDPAAAATGSLPAAQRYRTPGRLLYTYRGLGQPHPRHTRLDGHDVAVVLADYARPGAGPGVPEPVDTVDALAEHVRFDWWFGEANTRHLARAVRSREEFATDSTARLRELAALATTSRWAHRGHLAPFLTERGVR